MEKKVSPIMIFFAVLIFSLLFTCICMLPFVLIWAFNTLFKLAIAYTGWNWLACWVLILVFYGFNPANAAVSTRTKITKRKSK